MNFSILATSLLYSLVGCLFFVLILTLVNKLLPFSLHKELIEDENIALAIVLGASFLGLAMIITGAIHG